MQQNTVRQPIPYGTESEEAFIVRAHHALQTAIPDPADRNVAVWQAWDTTRGNELLSQAERYFDPQKYAVTEPRPFFMEHEKVNYGSDGSEQITNYDLNELTAIVRENNHRISDTDAYTALVDKHTLPPPYRDPSPPKNLGFVGPYRLGMMGRKNPRWGIFANEWQRADKKEQLQDRPNRSVEVLQLKANGRRYIDPIAALSEAPRLPLPSTAQYAASSNVEAVCVERYDASAMPAFPGGSNTDIKKTKQKKASDMYGSGSPDQDMIREVLNALMSTEEWKAISEAAATIGDEQPVVSGQDVIEDPAMSDPAMMDPAMMEETPISAEPRPEMMDNPPIPGNEEDMTEDPAMPMDRNGAGPGMMGYSADRNSPAAAAAVAARTAGSGAARTAGGGAARTAGGGGGGQMAKDIGIDLAANKLSQGKQGGERPQSQGILARILAGPKSANEASTPRLPGNQFGATKGYHRYSSSEETEMKRDQYAALASENQEMRKELSELKSHNDSLLTEQAEMYAATQHEVVQLRQKAIDAERQEKLQHLSSQYAAVDLKKELEECLYRNGNDMSNEDFDERFNLVQHYTAASAPQSPMIPLGYDGNLASGDIGADRFAAKVADKALELVNEGVKSGKHLKYEEAVAKAKASLEV